MAACIAEYLAKIRFFFDKSGMLGRKKPFHCHFVVKKRRPMPLRARVARVMRSAILL